MVTFICLFFPAVVSVGIFDYLSKRDIKLKSFIYRFCINAIIINTVCFAAKEFIFHTADQPLASFSDMVPHVALVYLAMSTVAAVALGIVEMYLAKNVDIYVEANNNDKNNRKEEN